MKASTNHLQGKAVAATPKEHGFSLFSAQKTYRMADGTYLVEDEVTKNEYHFVTPKSSRFGMSCDCSEFRFCHQLNPGHRCLHLWACFYAENAYRNEPSAGQRNQEVPLFPKEETTPDKNEADNTFVKNVSDLLEAIRRGVAS